MKWRMNEHANEHDIVDCENDTLREVNIAGGGETNTLVGETRNWLSRTLICFAHAHHQRLRVGISFHP